jgi:hypothetical protein
VPAGITNADDLIKQARKLRAKVDQEWNAKHPPCTKCGERDDTQSNGVCASCLRPCPICGGRNIYPSKPGKYRCFDCDQLPANEFLRRKAAATEAQAKQDAGAAA